VLARPCGRKGKEEKRRRGRRKKKKEKKRKEEEKEKGEKEKGKEKEKGRKNREKILGKIREIVRKIGKGFCGGFSWFFGRRRIFRDGGDGEANRSLGPRRARDSRPVADRDVGKARRGVADVRCRRESRHARRGERERGRGRERAVARV
jgi:hypothetical protein